MYILSYKLSKFLTSRGFDCIHVNHILDKWHTTDVDSAIYADKNDRILITKDVDFKNSYLLKKKPKKTVRIVLGNTSNKDLLKHFAKHLEQVINCNKSETFYSEMGQGLTVFNG